MTNIQIVSSSHNSVTESINVSHVGILPTCDRTAVTAESEQWTRGHLYKIVAPRHRGGVEYIKAGSADSWAFVACAVRCVHVHWLSVTLLPSYRHYHQSMIYWYMCILPSRHAINKHSTIFWIESVLISLRIYYTILAIIQPIAKPDLVRLIPRSETLHGRVIRATGRIVQLKLSFSLRHWPSY